MRDAGTTLTCALALLAAALGLACIPRQRPAQPLSTLRAFAMPARAQCAGAYGLPETVAALVAEDLAEVSGMVASARNAGVLWLHNDSGSDATLFAVSTTGAALGSLSLPGVAAEDFEDLAAAPCPDLVSACLYVCDCGDNELSRASLVVYAVLEPEVGVDRPLPEGSAAQQTWRFDLALPEGPANIEAFVVLPDASAMVFFEKQRSEARVLRLPAPWRLGESNALELAGLITSPGEDIEGGGVITDADLHPSGERLLLRTYVGVFEARLSPGTPDGPSVDSVDAADFLELFRPTDEPQGEAIAYDEQGTGIWTISEDPERSGNQPLHHAGCL